MWWSPPTEDSGPPLGNVSRERLFLSLYCPCQVRWLLALCNFPKPLQQHELLTWVQDLTGDASIDDVRPYLEGVSGLDWADTHRDYARKLILETYWLPRTPPPLRPFYPGGSSRVGFLAWGEDLAAVVRADTATLTRLGVTGPVVGETLKRLLDSYLRVVTELADLLSPDLDSLERTRLIEQALGAAGLVSHAVTAQLTRGYQRCPFTGCVYATRFCPHSHLEFCLVNRDSGETVRGPGLIWHLIADHQFFEGPQSPHRVDPEQLVKVLFQ